MKITRLDINEAADSIELGEDDYTVRTDYRGGMFSSCLGVTVPSAWDTRFVAALCIHLTVNGREDDALTLARKARVDSMGLDTIVYWPGVELVD
jgi:hypothetical protein